MNDMNLKFALAVNNNHRFENKHFGEAEKYLIYLWNGEKILFVGDVINKYKDYDKDNKHNSLKKGKIIIDFLLEFEVKILVSIQFGNNIKLVKGVFIPIIVDISEPEEAIKIIKKHIFWIEEEIKEKKTGFNLFTIKKSIMKSIIEK